MEICRSFTFLILLCFSAFLAFQCKVDASTNVSYDGRALLINGQRRVLISGSIHYPRSTPEMWPDLIAKSKDGGIDVIETYVFWNGHEPQPRQYYFEERFDLVRFLKTVQQAGLYAHLRIGPYACAEWNYGGFPVWMHAIPGIRFRTDNEPFKNEMQNFTTKIVELMKEEKLFAWQGGPIILTQIENEYGNVEKPYGEKGQLYIQWAAKMALSLNTGLPWVMCKQKEAPDPIINTCNGYYCDSFKPNSPKKPKMWTENWAGWFTAFGSSIPHRPTEDVAFAVARFYQRGGTFQNYYMYHGGTNFGRTPGGPFIATTYDYDAPIDEYGYIRQPKWGHLKELHKAIKLSEPALIRGRVNTTLLGKHLEATVYSKGSSLCAAFLSNKGLNHAATVQFNGNTYQLPAWSVSILPDCKNVVFNTAKVSVQTSLMGMEQVSTQSLHPAAASNVDTGNLSTNWSWHKEDVGIWGKDHFSAQGLLEQLYTVLDKSDFLWYTISVNIDENEPFLKNGSQLILQVVTRGHALHVFANGNFVGTQSGNYSISNFTYENPVTLKAGENQIALLSVTVGQANYGSFFDTWTSGLNGPVKLLGLKNGPLDLTDQTWDYQIGVKGEYLQLYSDAGAKQVEWISGADPPKQAALTWYKTEFNAPEGNDAVALDFSTLSKGQAWVNGNHIGRYIITLKAPADECSEVCDYKGPYDSSKCVTNCGQPSQTLYHVPRSWLQPTNNVLVLLEEVGGDPTGISLRKRQVDIVCAHVSQDHPTVNSSTSPELRLQCSSGQHISSISFASFGNPTGYCGNFIKGSHDAGSSTSLVENACVGNEACSISVSEDVFESHFDEHVTKSLAVEAVCKY